MRHHRVMAEAPSRLGALLALVGLMGLAASAAAQTAPGPDGTLIINPRLHVRASPTYLTQDVPVPVSVFVADGAGRGVSGAMVRLTNATNPQVVLGMGITGLGGRAIVGPVRASAAELQSGVRVEATGQAGTRSDLVLPVRPAANAFAVLEVRIIEPAEGSRPSIREGQPVRIVGLLRGIGTGTVTGWWEVNGMPVAPFNARMQSGAPVRVEPRDPAGIAARFRVGPNSIRIRTIFPNEYQSRATVIDVYRDRKATSDGAGRVQAVRFDLPAPDGVIVGATGHLTAAGQPFGLNLEITGQGSGEIQGEWWLDGAFMGDFAAVMRDGKAGPIRVPPQLLPVGEDATHYLRLRLLSPTAVDSPVFTYDVGGARGGQPVTIGLLAPAEGAELAGLPPVFRWSSVPAALQYHLSVGVEPAGADDLRSLWTGAVPPQPGDIVEFTPPGLLKWAPGQTYFWKVVALRPGEDVPSSQVGSFRTPAAAAGGDGQ